MTIKEASDNLGREVTYCGNPYIITAVIKRMTKKGIIWQVEVKPCKFRNSVAIVRAEDIEL